MVRSGEANNTELRRLKLQPLRKAKFSSASPQSDRSLGTSPAIFADGASVRTPPGDLMLTQSTPPFSHVLVKQLTAAYSRALSSDPVAARPDMLSIDSKLVLDTIVARSDHSWTPMH